MSGDASPPSTGAAWAKPAVAATGAIRPACSGPLPTGHDDAGTVEGNVRLAEGRDDAIASSLDRAQIDEQHLVFVVVNEGTQLMAAPRQIGGIELTLENRVLQVIAKPAHRLVDLRQPALVADVVADEERVAHVRSYRLDGAEPSPQAVQMKHRRVAAGQRHGGLFNVGIGRRIVTISGRRGSAAAPYGRSLTVSNGPNPICQLHQSVVSSARCRQELRERSLFQERRLKRRSARVRSCRNLELSDGFQMCSRSIRSCYLPNVTVEAMVVSRRVLTEGPAASHLVSAPSGHRARYQIP